MIFVTVGTQKFQFNRLFEKIDELIDSKIVTEPVFAQIGNSDYKPRNFEYVNFLQPIEFEDAIEKSDVLITHSGVATIVKGLYKKKIVIVVPRLKEFGEHVDNHQVQIAEAFSECNFIMNCYDINCLDEIIFKAKTHIFENYISQKDNVIKTIEDYIIVLENQKARNNCN